MKIKSIIAYIDFKSPYAYLALQPTRTLFKELDIKVNWLPYVLEIPDYLGSAKIDNNRKVIENQRNSHQWRRVKYSYMDCRRYANLRDITILGPRKIWDTKLISISLLWVIKKNALLTDKYIDYIYKNFWKRSLDIENFSIVQNMIKNIGISTVGFKNWSSTKGITELKLIMKNAHNKGVFGVPSYLLKDELFWGREQLPMIKARITNNYKNIY